MKSLSKLNMENVYTAGNIGLNNEKISNETFKLM